MRRSSSAAYSTVGTATDGMKAQVVIVDLCRIKAEADPFDRTTGIDFLIGNPAVQIS
jgi:hypothetical protein